MYIMNATNPSLNINDLVKNINKFIDKFDNKKHVEHKIENYYYEPIKKFIQTIILRQSLFNKKYWSNHGFRVEDNEKIHKCIYKIESNKILYNFYST